MIQEDIRFEGKASFLPPIDLWVVARSELTQEQYDQLPDWLNGRDLSPPSYIEFIEECR